MNSENASVDHIRLIDTGVFGTPTKKLVSAVSVIDELLHELYRPTFGEISKNSCVLCSLTVRDFLFKAGFRDAEVRPVKAIMRASRGDKELHSLGLGFANKGQQVEGARWPGHLVVTIPSENYLIDTTLFPAKRPEWPQLDGMVAAPIQRGTHEVYGLTALSGFAYGVPEDDYLFHLAWLDDPNNKQWKKAPDTSKRRREEVVNTMLKALKIAY